MLYVKCDKCETEAKLSMLGDMPEGWATVRYKKDGISGDKLHICPKCGAFVLGESDDS